MCWIKTREKLGCDAVDEYFENQFIKGTPPFSIASYIIHPKYRGPYNVFIYKFMS